MLNEENKIDINYLGIQWLEYLRGDICLLQERTNNIFFCMC